ncbi:MAG: ribbon-helix-helix domain-containing protein [Rickettsiaceae bacterium]
MCVQKEERTNVQQEQINIESHKKLKSRVVSNIPWYPKSERLKKELKLLALHEYSTVTSLIDEGIKMVLAKRGKDIKDYLQ